MYHPGHLLSIADSYPGLKAPFPAQEEGNAIFTFPCSVCAPSLSSNYRNAGLRHPNNTPNHLEETYSFEQGRV